MNNLLVISIFVLLIVGIVALIVVPKYHPILKIGLLVLLVIILREIAVTNSRMLGINPISAFSVSTPVIGIITFFGFMWLGDKTGGQVSLTKAGMRLAIVAAIVTVFIVLASSVVFFTGTAKLQPIAELFVQQFNITVGTVIVFYFGASAYIQAQSKEDKDQPKEDEQKG